MGESKGEGDDMKAGDGEVVEGWGNELKGEGDDMKAGDGEAVEGWGNGRGREVT